jgi:hypothetical protein
MEHTEIGKCVWVQAPGTPVRRLCSLSWVIEGSYFVQLQQLQELLVKPIIKQLRPYQIRGFVRFFTVLPLQPHYSDFYHQLYVK